MSLFRKLNNPMRNELSKAKHAANTDYKEVGRRISETRRRRGLTWPAQTAETRRQLSIRMKRDNPMYSPVTRAVVGEALRQRFLENPSLYPLHKAWVNEQYRENSRARMLANNPMKNPETVRKSLL